MTHSTAPSIVIIDDDPRMLSAIARLITSWGLRCATYTDGRAALAAMAQDPPDLLLVDIFMPEPDGFEVIAQVRRRVPATPIIAISGDIVRGHPTNALAMSELLGVAATIRKPIEPEPLRALIARTLASKAPPSAASSPCSG
jgi:CheY-like chemotaxis protein